MAQPVIAEPGVDLLSVALGLEDAGYTISSVLETRFTVGTLHTTTNPVIVLLNDQALQCILVEVVPEPTSPDSTPSLPEITGSWRALVRSLTGVAVEEHGRDVRASDLLVNEPISPVAAPACSVSGTPALCMASLHLMLHAAARQGAVMKAALGRAYVTIPGAVAHYVTLAMLGGFSGYILRSLWLLAAVPLVYVSAVAVRILWCARTGPEASPSPQRDYADELFH